MKNSTKISKGYRLKATTHKLIRNLKDLTRKNYDEILKKSCKLYFESLKDTKSKINKSNNKFLKIKTMKNENI